MRPFIFLLTLFVFTSTFAQRQVYVSLFAGGSNYRGDLNERFVTTEQMRRVFGVGLQFPATRHFALHATLLKGNVSAEDRFSRKETNRLRNQMFATNIYEGALSAEYYLADMKKAGINPYLYAGVALFRFNPWGRNAGELRYLGTEGQGFVEGRETYKLVTYAIPLGLGIQLRITDNSFAAISAGYRKTFTDYIDDVSTTYIDEEVLRRNRGQLAVNVAFRGDEIDPSLSYPPAGTPRGSLAGSDSYYFVGIRLLLCITNEEGRLFGKKLNRGKTDCPRW